MSNHTYSTEKAIIEFCENINAPVDKNILKSFMIDYKSRSYINLTVDTFLLTCSFLELNDAISFVRVNKNYMTFYQYLWENSAYYKMGFPLSIISNKEYDIIKENLQLDSYHYILMSTYLVFALDEPFQTIWANEKLIQSTIIDIEKASDINEITSYKEKIKEYEMCINKNIICLQNEFYMFLKTFMCVSQTYNNKPFLSIKKPMDMRLYGLSSDKHKSYWEKTGVNWATYEYEYEETFDRIDDHISDTDEFYYYNSNNELITYEYVKNNPRRYDYKVRKPPIWEVNFKSN